MLIHQGGWLSLSFQRRAKEVGTSRNEIREVGGRPFKWASVFSPSAKALSPCVVDLSHSNFQLAWLMALYLIS